MCKNLHNVQAWISHKYNLWERTLKRKLHQASIAIPDFTSENPLFDDPMLLNTVLIDPEAVHECDLPDYVEKGVERDSPRRVDLTGAGADGEAVQIEIRVESA